MAAKRFPAIAVLALALAGCCTAEPRVEIQRVEVPVQVRPSPPTDLKAVYVPDRLPVFVPANHPDASSALTPDGETSLRLILHDLLTRDRAWRLWAAPDDEQD